MKDCLDLYIVIYFVCYIFNKVAFVEKYHLYGIFFFFLYYCIDFVIFSYIAVKDEGNQSLECLLEK